MDNYNLEDISIFMKGKHKYNPRSDIELEDNEAAYHITIHAL